MANLLQSFNAIAYNHDEELLQSPAKKNLDKFVYQGVLGTAYAIMCSGIFLSGYLISLGASDTLVSYINILGSICGIFLIFVATWVQQKIHRRKILLTINIISKTFTMSAIFVPLIIPSGYQIIIAFTLVILGNIFAALNGVLFNSWYVEIIPKPISGRYYSVRMIFALIASVVVPIFASIILDWFNKEYIGFFILFMLAMTSGIAELFVFAKIDDVTFVPEKTKVSLIKTFTIPLKNKPFMSFLIRQCLLNLFLFTGASITATYQIKYLGLSYTYMNIIAIISPIIQVAFFLKFWGIITDKLSFSFVYTITSAMLAIDMFLWACITPKTMYFVFPILYTWAGIEWAGLNMSSFNKRFEVIPQETRVIHDSFFSFAIGIVLFLCPIISKFIRDIASKSDFVNSFTFGSFRITFIIAAIGIFLLSVINIIQDKKTGENLDLFKKHSYVYSIHVLKSLVNWKILGFSVSIVGGITLIILLLKAFLLN